MISLIEDNTATLDKYDTTLEAASVMHLHQESDSNPTGSFPTDKVSRTNIDNDEMSVLKANDNDTPTKLVPVPKSSKVLVVGFVDQEIARPTKSAGENTSPVSASASESTLSYEQIEDKALIPPSAHEVEQAKVDDVTPIDLAVASKSLKADGVGLYHRFISFLKKSIGDGVLIDELSLDLSAISEEYDTTLEAGSMMYINEESDSNPIISSSTNQLRNNNARRLLPDGWNEANIGPDERGENVVSSSYTLSGDTIQMSAVTGGEFFTISQNCHLLFMLHHVSNKTNKYVCCRHCSPCRLVLLHL